MTWDKQALRVEVGGFCLGVDCLSPQTTQETRQGLQGELSRASESRSQQHEVFQWQKSASNLLLFLIFS